MKNVLLASAAVLAIAVSPTFAAAQGAKAGADHSFVKEAASGGMAEVELGRLAAERASSPEVKQFGQRMVDDHTKANDELKAIAQRKNIALPTDVPSKHKALQQRLSKLSGAAFDRAYMKEMVKDHHHDVAAFQKESRSGKDPDLKAFASNTLPTLQDHLRMAEMTDKAVGTTGQK